MVDPAERRYLTRRPLTLSQLPAHPTLRTSTTSAASQPELETFLLDVLTEGTRLADEGLPTLFKSSSKKPSPPSTAKVELLTADLPSPDKAAPPEPWFARRSRHEDKAAAGTASWDEFARALLQNHSENEKEYTPDVIDAHEVVSWNNVIQKELQGEVGGEDGYTNVGMRVLEMVHHIPAPLNNRVFSVVVVTGKTGDDGFVVAQVPVDVTPFPVEMVRYVNGRNRREDGGDEEARKKTIPAVYASVERCRRVAKGTSEKGEDEVLWEMATTSDAKGNLPMWAQKMGVPGAVVKDVGLVIDWTEKTRKS